MSKLLLWMSLLLSLTLLSCGDEPGGGEDNQGGGKSNSNVNHEYVDLGLPSGTLWATMNVGASRPEDFGDYYAWGERTTKQDYSVEIYKWFNHATGKYAYLDGKTALNPEDDAAYVNWGKEWRMPTMTQFEELREECTWQWKGSGFLLTSKKNGKTLFLPAAGYRDRSELYNAGSDGYYWSRDNGGSFGACFMDFSLTGRGLLAGGNNLGRSVRAVRAPLDSSSQETPDTPGADGTMTFTVNGVSFKMIQVQGGTFTMGATAEQDNDGDPAVIPHQVTLSDYCIGQTEVTQALWVAVMGGNPSYFNGGSHGTNLQRPVETVSWNECSQFIAKLNQLTGKNFRFPTEAEWEYAARGGNKSKTYKYSGSNTIIDVAWYKDDNTSQSSVSTQTVATKQPNELGIYDMSGNVWEWCYDWFDNYSSSAQVNPVGPSSGDYRVLRGGSWDRIAWFCRVSFHGYGHPDFRSNEYGLRIAL